MDPRRLRANFCKRPVRVLVVAGLAVIVGASTGGSGAIASSAGSFSRGGNGGLQSNRTAGGTAVSLAPKVVDKGTDPRKFASAGRPLSRDRSALLKGQQFGALGARLVTQGANLSGAVVDSPGCHQYTQPGGFYDSRLTALPFWINFYGKAYHHIWVNTEGYTWFDGTTDPNSNGGQPSPLHQEYDNYQNRIIAPFMAFGDEWTQAGTSPVSWGATTYNGHQAFCVLWGGGYNWEACVINEPGVIDYSKTNTFQMLLVRRNDLGYDDFDIIFNYGSIQWDHPGTDAWDAQLGYKCGDAAGVGWKVGTSGGASALLDGSWTYGSFLDTSSTGLIYGSLGSSQPGQYVWNIHNSTPAPHVDPLQLFGPPSDGLGGDGSWGVNPTATEGEPVDSANGSYYTSSTDLSLPGIGVPFTFMRSYNSADPTAGALGPGWTDNLNAFLVVQSNGDVIGHSGDGQQLYFTLNPDGSFTPPAGGRASLTATGGGYELITHDQLHYGFNSQGQLLSERDRNGQGLTFTDNPDGTLASVVDSVGRTISFTYISGGLLSQVTLPDGRNVKYGYDASGRLQTVTDLRGGLTTYTYDSSGRLATITDQNNHKVVQNTYGSDGRLTQQIDADGGISYFAWDPSTQTATYTDPRGNSSQDVYLNGVLTDQIDPFGNDTHYVYDADLNVTAVVDPLGNETDMTYDSRGNLLTKAGPVAVTCGTWPSTHPCTQTWAYNSLNDLTSYTTAGGHTTTYGYDGAGNLTSKTEPDPGSGSPVILYGRDPAGTGLLTSITDPNGRKTTYGYTNGNLTSITTPLGETTTMTYDGSGRMLTRVDPRGNVTGGNPSQYTTTFTYDNANHLHTQTDPLGDTTTYNYDPAGNLQSVQDANHNTTSYGYDNANHLTTVTAPDLTQTIYGYDANGNLTSRKDANNHTTNYGYDAANQLTSTQLQGGQKWAYTYDANGNRQTTVDPNGVTTGYGYDALNRLTTKNYSDSTPTITYKYDDDGNIFTAGEGFQYDALGRVIGAQGVSYTYDQAGNIIRRTYPGNITDTYAYDNDERLQTVTSAAGTTSYNYDAAGNPTTTTLPAGNGYVETKTYDRAGRLTEVKTQKGSSVLADVVLTLDPIGQPLSVVRTGATSLTANYTYDNRNRLTQVCYQASPCTGSTSPYIKWTYDPVGNRQTQTQPSGTTNYTYDSNDRLLSAGPTSYSYDADGNQTAAGSTTFTYNAAGEMTSSTSGRTTTTYTYSGDGHRLSASTGSQTAATTQYVWDMAGGPLPQIALEEDGSGSTQRSYLYGLNRIAMTTGGATYYYHYDQLGSAINLTNSSGATQWTDSYDPFGTIHSETKNANKAPANYMKFDGQYLDPTGLYHLRARQYDPTTGRFLSPDPLQPTATSPYTGAYVYGGNDPTLYTDPSGQCFLLCAIAGAVINEGLYAGGAAIGLHSFSWTGAAEAAGEGLIIGAAGGLGAEAGAQYFGEFIGAAAGRTLGAALFGAAGGAFAVQASSLASGCGLASGGETETGALVGAASAGAAEWLFPQRGFETRTLRGLFRNRPNARKIWAGATTSGAVGLPFGGATVACGLGVNGK